MWTHAPLRKAEIGADVSPGAIGNRLDEVLQSNPAVQSGRNATRARGLPRRANAA